MTPAEIAGEIRDRAAEVRASNHAKRRAKERLGIPYKASLRTARLAAKRGAAFEIPYDSKPSVAFILGDAVWVFHLKTRHPLAVTVLNFNQMSKDQSFHMRPITLEAVDE